MRVGEQTSSHALLARDGRDGAPRGGVERRLAVVHLHPPPHHVQRIDGGLGEQPGEGA